MSTVDRRFLEKAMPLILIVDDSPTELFQMTKALEKGGFRVEGAADGEEALRKAREMKPDLILMDIVMPGMDGFRATRALSNDPATRSIPVIMVSSKNQETDRIWGMRQGAVDFIVKPVTPALLLEKAQAALMAG
jgi:twitching motility two-component system response regulator PilH